jgi:hypothetical protein
MIRIEDDTDGGLTFEPESAIEGIALDLSEWLTEAADEADMDRRFAAAIGWLFHHHPELSNAECKVVLHTVGLVLHDLWRDGPEAGEAPRRPAGRPAAIRAPDGHGNTQEQNNCSISNGLITMSTKLSLPAMTRTGAIKTAGILGYQPTGRPRPSVRNRPKTTASANRDGHQTGTESGPAAQRTKSEIDG